MSKTNIWQDVTEFHNAFNHPVESEPIQLGEISVPICKALRDTREVLDVLAKSLSLHAKTSDDKAVKLRLLRISLLAEEFGEYIGAERADDIVEIADALGDLHYIAAGTEIAYGIPGQEVFSEIQRSNMAKLDSEGKPIYREDGKVIKPEGWKSPQIEKILNKEKV